MFLWQSGVDDPNFGYDLLTELIRTFLAYADDVRAQDSAAYAIQVCLVCFFSTRYTWRHTDFSRVSSYTVGTTVHIWVPWGQNWLARPPSVEEVPWTHSRNTGTSPQQQVKSSHACKRSRPVVCLKHNFCILTFQPFFFNSYHYSPTFFLQI